VNQDKKAVLLSVLLFYPCCKSHVRSATGHTVYVGFLYTYGSSTI